MRGHIVVGATRTGPSGFVSFAADWLRFFWKAGAVRLVLLWAPVCVLFWNSGLVGEHIGIANGRPLRCGWS